MSLTFESNKNLDIPFESIEEDNSKSNEIVLQNFEECPEVLENYENGILTRY